MHSSVSIKIANVGISSPSDQQLNYLNFIPQDSLMQSSAVHLLGSGVDV